MFQFLRFAAVGVLNTGIGYAVIFGCMYLAKLGAVPSNLIGYSVGIVVSYALNRTFTFRSVAKPRSEMPRFVMIFALAYFFNLCTLLFLIHALGMHEGGAQIIAGFVYFALSFVLNKYYVFSNAKTRTPQTETKN